MIGRVVIPLLSTAGAVVATRLYFRWQGAQGYRQRIQAWDSIMEKALQSEPGILYTTGFQVIDGLQFFFQRWMPKDPDHNRVIIINVHSLYGFGGHLVYVIKQFVEQGIEIFSYDQRGHGRTEGLHGFIESVDALREDLKAMVDLIRNSPDNYGVPIFIMGESMGGLIALQFLRKYGNLINGCILLSPLIEPAGAIHPPKMVEMGGRLMRYILPELPTVKANQGFGFTDQAMLDEVISHPLCYGGRLRVGTGLALQDAFNELYLNFHEISTPFLVLHGTADTVVKLSGSQHLYDEARSKDKHLELWEGCDHALFHEKLESRQRIVQSICTWITNRV